jgi:lysozyme
MARATEETEGTGTPPPRRRRTRALAASAALTVLTALTVLAVQATALTAAPASAGTLPQGHDVSSHQRAVDWAAARARGASFVYVKATEATGYRNPYFARQYDGALRAGLLRGAYHFARPDLSSGAAQAAFFVRHGGAWRPDSRTLPPALDLEYDPHDRRQGPYDRRQGCYGLSGARTVAWIRAFSDEVLRLTGRRPVLYTTAHWWDTCTGGSRAFGADHALWIARHGSGPGTLPAGWSTWTFWQYDTGGGLPGDRNLFNGSPARLRAFARGPWRIQSPRTP